MKYGLFLLYSKEILLEISTTSVDLIFLERNSKLRNGTSSGSGGGEGAMAPPGPVKIGHKKDGRRRQPHRFHVSRPPPYPAAGSATGNRQL